MTRKRCLLYTSVISVSRKTSDICPLSILRISINWFTSRRILSELRHLCSEARQEVVLGLLRGQDGDRGQNAECVRRQEDDVLGCGCRGDGADDVLDVVDGVGHTGVLGDALICEVDVALSIQGNVLQQSVALDGVVDIGLGVLIQVDDLCVCLLYTSRCV